MSLRDDDRGASVQVGAILLFAFVIVAIASWQATVVPQDNAQVEFTHNQRVHDDMQEVRGVIVSAPGRTTLRSVAVDMAPEYPPRTLFVNPGQPSGTVRTVGTTDARQNVTIGNATATDGDAADYWNGTARAYGTGGLVYEPGYNVYTGAPDTVYENTVLYNEFDDGTVVSLVGSALVDGRTITLVALNGSLSRTSADAYTVDFTALSSSSRSLTVNNSSAGNVTVSFASRRDAGWWRDRLDGEFLADGGNVVAVRSEPLGAGHNVTVELAGNTTYTLRMAKVGVGTGTERPDASYVTDVDGNGSSVPEGGTQKLVVEVRDAYNNPVEGVTVRAAASLGSLRDGTVETDGDGQATFVYEAPGNVDGGPKDVDVNVTMVAGADPTLASFDATTAGNLTLALSVQNSDGSGLGGGGGGGGNAAYEVFWLNPPGATAGFSCDAEGDDCQLNASKSGSVDLTMDTDPTADGADVQFAVNNTTVGTLSPKSTTTDGTGQATTTLTARENGTVKVYASSGASGDVVNVTVFGVSGNTPPTAAFVYSPSTPSTGDVVEFDPSGSADSDGSVVEYRWDFDGDGTVDRTETTATNVTYSYADDGSYGATLTVVDNDSATDTTTKTVTVANQAPTASVTASCTQLDCSFDASGSSDADGSITDYTWDFGDGNSSYSSGTDPTVPHTYASPGTYTVTVTVTDDDGATATASTTVTVTQVMTGIVYADSNQYVRTVDRNGNVLTFDSLGSAEAMSPADVDFDGDGYDEIAYVNGSAGVTLVDRNNETRPLLTSGAKKTSLAVGTWQGSAQSVFYASSNDGNLYRKAPGGSAVQVAAFSNRNVVAVAGIGDVDGDGNDEITVALGSGNLGIVDDNGDTLRTGVTVGSNNNWGVGTPADFDGDGAERVPVVDGSNNLNLVSCSITTNPGGNKQVSCSETTVVSGGAAKTTVGAYDYDGDGVADLAYADTNQQLAYHDPADGTGGQVTDADGNPISVYGSAGVR